MRALTLTQPWAGLVASGLKLVENRPRRMIKREDFGTRFAIHAGRQEADLEAWRRVVEIAPEVAIDYPGPMAPGARTRKLMDIRSAVIAVATVVRDVTESEVATGALDALDSQRRWFFGPIGYVLRDVRALAAPVMCRGMLGFWKLPEYAECEVTKQLIPFIYPCGCSHRKVELGMCDMYEAGEVP